VAYALDDARYLPQARDVMLDRARELGREEWVREELAAYDEPTQYDDPDPWVQSTRLKGASRLSARQRGVLRELAAWREMEAGHRDIPRKHVVPDEVLTAAASRNVRSAQALGRIKGAFDRERYGQALLDAVERGLALDEDALPVRAERQDDDEIVNARVDFVLAYLKGKSLNLDVDPALVASRTEIAAFVREGAEAVADGHRLLRGWRGEFIGDELRALLGGRHSVRLDEETGLPALAE